MEKKKPQKQYKKEKNPTVLTQNSHKEKKFSHICRILRTGWIFQFSQRKNIECKLKNNRKIDKQTSMCK